MSLCPLYLKSTYQEPDNVIVYVMDSIVYGIRVQDWADKLAGVAEVHSPVVAKVTPLLDTHPNLIEPPKVNDSTMRWAV